jgi:hypothetical protein
MAAFDFRQRQKFYFCLFTPRPEGLWGLPIIQSSGYHGLFLGRRELHLVPRLRIRGVIPPLTNTSLWCGTWQFYLTDGIFRMPLNFMRHVINFWIRMGALERKLRTFKTSTIILCKRPASRFGRFIHGEKSLFIRWRRGCGLKIILSLCLNTKAWRCIGALVEKLHAAIYVCGKWDQFCEYLRRKYPSNSLLYSVETWTVLHYCFIISVSGFQKTLCQRTVRKLI